MPTKAGKVPMAKAGGLPKGFFQAKNVRPGEIIKMGDVLGGPLGRVMILDEATGDLRVDAVLEPERTAEEWLEEIAGSVRQVVEEEPDEEEQGVDVVVVRHFGPGSTGYFRGSVVEQDDADELPDRGGFGFGEGTVVKGEVLGAYGAGKSLAMLWSPTGEVEVTLPSTVTLPGTGELAEGMLPDAAIPTPTQVLLARREASVLWAMLQEFGAFTSEELADQRSSARNRHALANSWRSAGKIFSVEVKGRRLYPGFQFDPVSFAPEPIVARVLEALPVAEMSEWDAALWWVAADPWLRGRRPVDLMRSEPEAVLEAAAHLAEPSPL